MALIDRPIRDVQIPFTQDLTRACFTLMSTRLQPTAMVGVTLANQIANQIIAIQHLRTSTAMQTAQQSAKIVAHACTSTTTQLSQR
jgi:hypothetical protein